MVKKMVVLYLEGQTEVEFYREVVAHIRSKIPSRRFKIDKLDYLDVGGITKFSTKVLNKFQHEVFEKYEGY